MSVTVLVGPSVGASRGLEATCEAFGTHLARLAVKLKVHHKICRAGHLPWISLIVRFSWDLPSITLL